MKLAGKYSNLTPAERQVQLKKAREERRKEQSNQERFLTAEQKAKRKERFAASKKSQVPKGTNRSRPARKQKPSA